MIKFHFTSLINCLFKFIIYFLSNWWSIFILSLVWFFFFHNIKIQNCFPFSTFNFQDSLIILLFNFSFLSHSKLTFLNLIYRSRFSFKMNYFNYYSILSFNLDMWHHFTLHVISHYLHLSSHVCPCRLDLINNLDSWIILISCC